jgi:hypothetical protein
MAFHVEVLQLMQSKLEKIMKSRQERLRLGALAKLIRHIRSDKDGDEIPAKS